MPEPPRTTGADMKPLDESSDPTQLDDTAFLDERARVRGRLEHEPENAIGRPELERVYAAMTEEFLRRARIAWATAG
jgi:hypothetical protein